MLAPRSLDHNRRQERVRCGAQPLHTIQAPLHVCAANKGTTHVLLDGNGCVLCLRVRTPAQPATHGSLHTNGSPGLQSMLAPRSLNSHGCEAGASRKGKATRDALPLSHVLHCSPCLHASNACLQAHNGAANSHVSPTSHSHAPVSLQNNTRVSANRTQLPREPRIHPQAMHALQCHRCRFETNKVRALASSRQHCTHTRLQCVHGPHALCSGASGRGASDACLQANRSRAEPVVTRPDKPSAHVRLDARRSCCVCAELQVAGKREPQRKPARHCLQCNSGVAFLSQAQQRPSGKPRPRVGLQHNDGVHACAPLPDARPHASGRLDHGCCTAMHGKHGSRFAQRLAAAPVVLNHNSGASQVQERCARLSCLQGRAQTALQHSHSMQPQGSPTAGDVAPESGLDRRRC